MPQKPSALPRGTVASAIRGKRGQAFLLQGMLDGLAAIETRPGWGHRHQRQLCLQLSVDTIGVNYRRIGEEISEAR